MISSILPLTVPVRLASKTALGVVVVVRARLMVEDVMLAIVEVLVSDVSVLVSGVTGVTTSDTARMSALSGLLGALKL